jgi:hypothetical protein
MGHHRTRRTIALGATLAVALSVAVMLVVAEAGPAATQGKAWAQSAGWIPLGPSVLTRDESATAAVGKDIYVVGGFIGPTTTDQVERYDTAHDRWELVKPMPVTRNHLSAVSYGGQLYALGGYTNGLSNPGVPTSGLADASDEFLRYDPQSDSWSAMPHMPAARASAAAAVIDDKLYVAGGRDRLPTTVTSEGLLKRLDIFDFKTGRWTRGPDMAIAREHVAGTAAGGAFYVLGGRLSYDRGTLGIPAVERYVPSERRWERVADMSVAHNGFAATTVGGRIVVFGSEEPSTPEFHLDNAVTESFDPATGRWSALPDMRTPRGALGGAAIGQRVYAIEGITAQPGTTCCLGSNVVEALDVPGATHHAPPVAHSHDPLGLPSTSSCLRVPRLALRLRAPSRGRFVRVEVFVNGRRVLTRRGHRIRRIVLHDLPQGRFRLKVVATTNRGRRISSARTYLGCVGR